MMADKSDGNCDKVCSVSIECASGSERAPHVPNAAAALAEAHRAGGTGDCGRGRVGRRHGLGTGLGGVVGSVVGSPWHLGGPARLR